MNDIEGGLFMKIGLPRGLLYHSYGSFMDAFFEALPVEVEVSQKTDLSAGQSILRPCGNAAGEMR